MPSKSRLAYRGFMYLYYQECLLFMQHSKRWGKRQKTGVKCMIVEFIIVLAGLIISWVLFNRFPQIKGRFSIDSLLRISVIIPARNEEKNLPLLLDDLKKQSTLIYEIICVDDGSADDTVKIASSFGARVISLQDKPEDWTGKTWACQNGADAARGDLFLFLDADVRLSVDGIGTLLYAYEENGSVISVQPYHQTEKIYEYFSLFFNLIQYAANGLGLPKKKNAGLYGPVILISRSDYYAIDGHRSVKNSVVEDMDLGERLKQSKIDFHLFLGNRDIAYRMYGDGFKSLLQGWIKNLAAGMAKINIGVLLMSFL
jgi:4,4'-diaponeurosporenoate glycosyltransferase